MRIIYQRFTTLGFAFFLGASTLFAQTIESVLPKSAKKERCEPRETIWQQGDSARFIPVTRAAFRQAAPGVAEVQDCDTTLQTFTLKRRQSPWKLSFNLGPNLAYCGSWEGTLGPNKRDNTLYNGAGLHLSTGADYFLLRKDRLQLGVGGVFGYQNFYTRKSYRDFLYAQADKLGINRSNVKILNHPSEDLFLTVGPTLTYDLKKGNGLTCVPYLEAALRGGVYRSQAALVGAKEVIGDQSRLIRLVTAGPRFYRPGVNFSLGAFFPVNGNWHWGLQMQGWLTRQDYMIMNGAENPTAVYSFNRRHGGFNAALAVRRSFTEKKLTPKSLAGDCGTCDGDLALAVQSSGRNINGFSLVPGDDFAPSIAWKSITTADRNERFSVVLLHKDYDAEGNTMDTLKVSKADKAASMDLAGLNLRKPGVYHIIAQRQQQTMCGWQNCGLQIASFAVKQQDNGSTESKNCLYQHSLSNIVVTYTTSKVVTVKEVCYCSGERQETGRMIPLKRYKSGAIPQTISQPIVYSNMSSNVQLPTGGEAEQLNRILNDLRKQVAEKGGTVKSIVATYRMEALPCESNPTPGPAVEYQLNLTKSGSPSIISITPKKKPAPVVERRTIKSKKG